MALELPIDGSRITMIASGKLMPKAVYAQLADGSSRRVPDKQAEEEGVPLWVVDCFLDDGQEEGRASVAGVTVGSYDRPKVGKFQPVVFQNLSARVYVDRSGRVAVSWTADMITEAHVKAA